jgi:hypothetical protein
MTYVTAFWTSVIAALVLFVTTAVVRNEVVNMGLRALDTTSRVYQMIAVFGAVLLVSAVYVLASFDPTLGSMSEADAIAFTTSLLLGMAFLGSAMYVMPTVAAGLADAEWRLVEMIDLATSL